MRKQATKVRVGKDVLGIVMSETDDGTLIIQGRDGKVKRLHLHRDEPVTITPEPVIIQSKMPTAWKLLFMLLTVAIGCLAFALAIRLYQLLS